MQHEAQRAGGSTVHDAGAGSHARARSHVGREAVHAHVALGARQRPAVGRAVDLDGDATPGEGERRIALEDVVVVELDRIRLSVAILALLPGHVFY